MSIFNNTGWSYDTGSGIAGTVSAEGYEITAGEARIHVNAPDGSRYRIIGSGFGFGLSNLPANLSGSDADMLSAGTSIYGFNSPSLEIEDFSSFMVLYSLNGTYQMSGISGSLAFFVHPTAWEKVKLAAMATSPLGLVGVIAELTSSFKAVCSFAGMQVSTPIVGADLTGTAYWITSTNLIQ
jgi:hypothetical protein